MNGSGLNLVTVGAFLGVLAIFAAIRIAKHDTSKQGGSDKVVRSNGALVMLGTALITLTAAWWWPQIYQATDHGFGLVVLAVPLAFGVDAFLHIARNHSNKDKVKTPVFAAAFAIAAVLVLGNFAQIQHNLPQLPHQLGSQLTAQLTSIHKNGR